VITATGVAFAGVDASVRTADGTAPGGGPVPRGREAGVAGPFVRQFGVAASAFRAASRFGVRFERKLKTALNLPPEAGPGMTRDRQVAIGRATSGMTSDR
ncbi:MAG: hypothetical protein J2P53_05980, partial [Bradyrhizobiaceae bacterium]|nr:hypothetical protein [Bradyrhizobiaceae bacterium]